MVSNNDSTIHNIFSMIESGEWDTADVFLERLVKDSYDSADDSSNEVVGSTINHFLSKKLMAPVNFLFYKDGLLVENSFRR